MADFVQTMQDWRRMCQHMEKIGGDRSCDICPLGGCNAIYEDDGNTDYAEIGEKVATWAAEHPEPVYETWFEYLLRIGVIPENAPAGGEYQWIVESIKHKHISNDIAESLKLHPKEVQA